MNELNWWELLRDPLPGRVPKPRLAGLTMVIDTGIPLSMFRDLLQMASDHVDFWKFGFGSAGVCSPESIHSKVSLCQEYGVLAYPGGTSLEIAIVQNVWELYLESLWKSGIRVIEVSDGTIDLPVHTRRQVIRTAKEMGFTILSEVGKKAEGTFLAVEEQAEIIRGDLAEGAKYILVEGREGGESVGVYGPHGEVHDSDVEALVNALGPLSTRLIWEAPQRKQQIYHIRRFGNRVNLGNVKPIDIVALESIRRGLRSDTFSMMLETDSGKSAPSSQSENPKSAKPGSSSGGGTGSRPVLWKPNPNLSSRPAAEGPQNPPKKDDR
ncbi:phosphosulfolactate synthase [Alicyclobacillus ferrooxydans]|uniref:phosphosulfolactate synthase n=1 Tax=Alicyclobacillus ferrooxydans TaxID=471514 RepID=UPI0006D5A36F|nr:phosphosulfolactate synthase [Alicyclobacillus ferrooxydans]